jgi:uncharacterized protein (DUF305 family)
MQNHQEQPNPSLTYLTCFDRILQDMIVGMTRPAPRGSISGLFIRQMIPHHEAAIRMSENLLCYTAPSEQMTNCACRHPMPYEREVTIPLNKIAKNIIEEQTKSIQNMKDAFYCCSEQENNNQDMRRYMLSFRSITRTMFLEMKRVPRTERIPCDFIREMIPHHEGAIKMSESALCFSVCPQLIPILDAIIISQKEGIRQMKKLLDMASSPFDRDHI